MYNHKGIHPVISSALILIITVTAVIGFQSWYNSFSSGFLNEIENEISAKNTIELKSVMGEKLYINSFKNDKIKELSINNVICDNNETLHHGINTINITKCINNTQKNFITVFLRTNNNVLTTKQFYIEKSYTNNSKKESQNQFYWTAEDYVTGETPNESWRNDLNVNSFEIKQDSNSRKYMDVQGDESFLIFTDVSKVKEAEIWIKVKTPSSSSNSAFFVRGQHTNNLNNVSAARIDRKPSGGGEDSLSEWNKGGWNKLDSQSLTGNKSTIVEKRLTAHNNNTLEGYVWREGNTEPSTPDLVATTAIEEKGLVGVMRWKDALHIYEFGVGINGTSAPKE